MKIEVLGPGCPNCKKLEENVRAAVDELGIDADVVKVTEMGQIMARGVMSTPAVVVDGKVKSTGKLLSKDDVKSILS